MDITSPNPKKNIESTLHEVIDKVADKEMDVIASLADGSHKTVESLAYRAAQLEDTYHQLLDKGRSCIQSSPLKCLSIAIVLSFTLGKLLNKRRN